jgi:Tfp pilus assembly protein PilZ
MRIDLEIADSGPRVILRGKVISRRDKPEGNAPAGCSVALGPEEREKVNYLNGFVRGGLLNLRERRRLPVRLPVTYGGLEGPCRSFTRDINEEGVFVVAEEPLPEESEVHLLIEVPGAAEPISLAGKVSHTVVIEDDDVPGMGILFQLTPEQRTAFETMIDELEQAFLKGALPEETLL